jgi:hypothetical protein
MRKLFQRRVAITPTPLIERLRGFLCPKPCGKFWPLPKAQLKAIETIKKMFSIQIFMSCVSKNTTLSIFETMHVVA